MSPTNDWTYASRGGTRYPVQPGDLWGVADHRILCGDLELGAADALLAVTGANPTMVYTDPPWNPGVHRSFRTKAGLGEYASFDDLMVNWLAPAAMFAPFTLAEMGKTGIKTLLRLAATVGFRVDAEWDVTYFKTTNSKLYGLVPADRPAPQWPDFTGLDDSVTPGVAVRELTAEGDTVVDFCTGLGFTAVAAAGNGRRFVGSELHQNRVSATLHQLAGITGQQPEVVGRVEPVAQSPIYAADRS